MSINLNAIEPASGGVMADVIGGFYLNYFPFGHDAFYDAMQAEKPPIQHNFTVLCLDWFYVLSAVTDYDARNEDSVLFARSIAHLLKPDPPRHLKTSAQNSRMSMTVDYKDGVSVEKAVAMFLCAAPDSYKPFIEGMLRMHKTLQQNFSRFCAEWLKTVPDNPAMQKSPLLGTVKNVMALYRGLPYI